MKSLSRSRITQIQTECVTRYYVDKNFSVHLEVGLNSGGKLRADVVALNTKGKIVIVEIKSSWADFATDKKWRKYLDYCHKFYFAIPSHLFHSEKGQFIKQLCRENKVGLIVIGPYDQYDKHARSVIKKRDQLVSVSNVFATFETGCGDTEVEHDKQFWLFRKLAWRAGISVANCSSRTKAFVEVEEEYQFDKSMNEYDFMQLDPLQQYQYLKRFPKSGFKRTLQDVTNRLRFEKTYRNRMKRLRPRQV